MKRIALVLALLLAGSVTAAAAQTRVSVAVGFGVPRPYVSGFVVVGRPAPYFYYRPWYRRPALVVIERAPEFEGRHYGWRYRGYRSYRPERACRAHFRCGF